MTTKISKKNYNIIFKSTFDKLSSFWNLAIEVQQHQKKYLIFVNVSFLYL